MKKLRKATKKLVAFAVAMALLCSANVLPVSAAVNPGGGSDTTNGVITPWPANTYFTCNGNSISTNLFGVRAGDTVRVDVTVSSTGGTYPELGLQVHLVKKYPNEATMSTTKFYWAGNHSYTFTITEGGSYYVIFATRADCRYRFTYSITY